MFGCFKSTHRNCIREALASANITWENAKKPARNGKGHIPDRNATFVAQGFNPLGSRCGFVRAEGLNREKLIGQLLGAVPGC